MQAADPHMGLIWDESRTCLVLFCFCLVLYSSKTKTCKPFRYQRDYKATVIIVYRIFVYIVNLVCINGSRYTRHVSVISGHLISVGFHRSTGCQQDPWDLGRHMHNKSYMQHL